MIPVPPFRQTLSQPFQLTGITIHGGVQAIVTVSPNPHGSGVLFGHSNGAEIPATYKNVVHTRNATTLSHGDTAVTTVEHILSALYALCVHDAVITCTQSEIPIMDGGSVDFVDAIKTAGVTTTDHRLSYIRITKDISVCDKNGGVVTLSPYDGFYIDATIDFTHPAIGRQQFSTDISPPIYATQIAPARTFGFMDQLLHYQKYDLARGASIDTAVIFGDDTPLNRLRFADEPIRHKVLDIIGDISLSPYPIIGKITAVKMGHALNNRALHTLFADSDAYDIIHTI